MFLSRLKSQIRLKAPGLPPTPPATVAHSGCDSDRVSLNPRGQVEELLLSAHEIPRTSLNYSRAGVGPAESHRAAESAAGFEVSGVCRARGTCGKGTGDTSQRGWGLKANGFGWHGEN